MELVEKQSDSAVINFSLSELLIVNNALNEVCHGIDLFEFETRMGANKDEVKILLSGIGKVIDQISQK